MRRLVAITLAPLAIGCFEHQEPPGATLEAEPQPVVVEARGASSDDAGTDATTYQVAKQAIGTVADNLPFKPDGTKLGSIAWRTWVYTDTGPKRTRYGYLRAGAIVDARGPAIVNDGCAGGWYRINPRGFVCLGKGATLDLEHPLLAMTAVRAVRGQALPYLYALSSDQPPYLYFKLPSAAQMKTVEGDGIEGQVARWRQRIKTQGLENVIGEPTDPPAFLTNGAKLEKPYGVQKRLHYSTHSGRASADSGFAIQQVISWEDRVFGLTTELDLVALDRTRVVEPSAFHGVELAEDEGLPVAFVDQHYVERHKRNENGEMVSDGSFRHREGIKLTGLVRPGGFWETRDGFYLVGAVARIIKPRDSFPSFATGTRKWIDISIKHQTLVAYVGQTPVYATLISSGRGGMGDPEKHQATIRGTFMIHAKHVAATMDGEEDKSDSFNLRDVPFVQYFHKGFALHGTYWHDEFGKVRSHGCVNLAPVDAAWLFEWTDPRVPAEWHSVLNKERGTVVYIHA